MAASQEPAKIWMRLEKTDHEGNPRKFIIRNLPISITDRCIEMFKRITLVETPILPAVLKKVKDEKTEFLDFWAKHLIPQGNCIVCVEDNDEPIETKEIIGINFLFINRKGDPPPPFPKDNPLMVVFEAIGKNYNIFEEYNCTEYMNAYALLVDKKYRGLKLGQHMLEAREIICKELGIKVTATNFTSKVGQILANRLNYRLIYEMEYSKLSRLANIDIDKKFHSCMIMAKYIE